jgi:hypothetical protein
VLFRHSAHCTGRWTRLGFRSTDLGGSIYRHSCAANPPSSALVRHLAIAYVGADLGVIVCLVSVKCSAQSSGRNRLVPAPNVRRHSSSRCLAPSFLCRLVLFGGFQRAAIDMVRSYLISEIYFCDFSGYQMDRVSSRPRMSMIVNHMPEGNPYVQGRLTEKRLGLVLGAMQPDHNCRM